MRFETSVMDLTLLQPAKLAYSVLGTQQNRLC
jgi:hypothetical protein